MKFNIFFFIQTSIVHSAFVEVFLSCLNFDLDKYGIQINTSNKIFQIKQQKYKKLCWKSFHEFNICLFSN